MKKSSLFLSGIAIGFVNAFFGAGGGIIAVPILKKSGLSQREAQATSLSITLPMTLITCILYYVQGNLPIKTALEFLPFGFLGALVGAAALGRISNGVLHKAFAIFMIWSGIRMVFR